MVTLITYLRAERLWGANVTGSIVTEFKGKGNTDH